MNWRALLTNRWALAGVGVAAAAGLYVLYKRRGGGGSGGGMAQEAPGYAGGGVGSFDSTGTDVAAWLGQYSASLQAQLDEYKREVTDALEAMKKVPTRPRVVAVPTVPPKPIPWLPQPRRTVTTG